MVNYSNKVRGLLEFREYFGDELKKIMDARPDVTLDDLAGHLKDVFKGANRGSAKNIISKYRAGKLKDNWQKRIPHILQFYGVKPNSDFVVNIKAQFPDFVYPPSTMQEKYYSSLSEKMKLLTSRQKKQLAQVGNIEDLTSELLKEFELTVDFLIKKNEKKKK